ncbi:hypothetical protein AAG570_001135 [Ranatra chinensis]|uniref:Uncharacterized protein n=1 Tax=Ranatra chinensis TaxID=642074 RepID=A0ABD0YBQ5_9HEMI
MCDKCCPLYNNEEWQEGPFNCAKCQCHGHAKACRYSSEIAAAAISLDASGNYSGGGECINCSVSYFNIYTIAELEHIRSQMNNIFPAWKSNYLWSLYMGAQVAACREWFLLKSKQVLNVLLW